MNSTAQTSDWAITDDTLTAIDAIFSAFSNTTPGCAMAVYRGGEIVYANGYGLSNLEHNVPITPDSIFHIASISKQFTAMCIALLQDDGLLDVDDPVQKYVPGLPAYDSPIMVRHLIHHVSGIRDQWMLLRLAGWREDDVITEDDCFDLIKRQNEINFTPNTEYMYSNSGYTLMAKIVRAVSGQSLREFAHERIFAPLGMTNTHFHDDHTEIVPGRTQAYQPRDGGGYRISIPPFDVVGTTSLHTTVADFAKWNANFTTAEICSEAVMKQAQTPGVFNDGKPMEYAWGLTVDTWRGQRRVGHDGADHGYRSSYFRLPDLDFAVTVFANLSTAGPGQLAEKIAEAVLGDHLQADPTSSKDESSGDRERTIVPVEPHAIAGVFIAEKTEGSSLPQHVVLRERDGEVVISTWGDATPLRLKADGSFDVHNGIGLIWAETAPVDGVVDRIGVRYFKAEMSYYTRLDASNLKRPIADFAGRYYAPELDTAMQLDVSASGEALLWKQRKLEDQEVAVVGEDTLGLGSLGASTWLEFSFDDTGAPTGFRLSAGRLRNLRFARQ